MNHSDGKPRASLKSPLTEKAVEVGALFGSVLSRVEENAPPSVDHVDVELVLETVNVDEKGFLVFLRSAERSSIRLSLATRLHTSGPRPK
ncbi:MAG: hypothetical protein Kow00107_00850 [Planctomycetota bacterium]